MLSAAAAPKIIYDSEIYFFFLFRNVSSNDHLLHLFKSFDIIV